jgi:hypothetical protein
MDISDNHSDANPDPVDLCGVSFPGSLTTWAFAVQNDSFFKNS